MIPIANDKLLDGNEVAEIPELVHLWDKSGRPKWRECLPPADFIINGSPFWKLSVLISWVQAKGIIPWTPIMGAVYREYEYEPRQKTLAQISEDLDLVNLARLRWIGCFWQILEKLCGQGFTTDQAMMALPEPFMDFSHMRPHLGGPGRISLTYWLFRDIREWMERHKGNLC